MGGQGRGRRRHLTAGLAPAAAAVVARAADLAAGAGMTAYLVGGTVRDLLLGRPLRDLDLLVTGDAPALARSLGRGLGAQVASHARFGTASVKLPEAPWRLDLASARRERYAGAGRLPDVAPGDIGQDLTRRDFTVNAMAWRLGPPPGERLLDPMGGRADLKRGLIRILHPASFRDDPTRAFRAVRLAARLGFRLEPATARALDQAVAEGRVRAVTPARLGRELRLLIAEEDWPRAVAVADRRGLLAGLRPPLAAPAVEIRRRLRRLLAPYPEGERLPAALAALLLAGEGACQGVAEAQWPGGVAARAQGLAEAARLRLANLPGAAGVAALLDRLPQLAEDDLRVLALVQAFAPAPACRRALGVLRRRRARLRLDISAIDLAAAGVPPGPELGRRLSAVRRQRLAGRLRSRRSQLAFALDPAAAGPWGGAPGKV